MSLMYSRLGELSARLGKARILYYAFFEIYKSALSLYPLAF